MKKTLIISLMMVLSLSLYSQQANKHNSQTQYCCVNKDYCGAKVKRCPNDNLPMIKNGFYYCTECHKSKKKPGECGRCDVPLIKMEVKD